MRTPFRLIASLLLLGSPAVFGQESLCDPCFDPPLQKKSLFDPIPADPDAMHAPPRKLSDIQDFFGTRTLTLVNRRVRSELESPSAAPDEPAREAPVAGQSGRDRAGDAERAEQDTPSGQPGAPSND